MDPMDIDPQETQEWLDALETVLMNEGTERAHFLLEKLVEKARRSGAYLPYSANTAYINTIPPGKEERSPGDHALEHRIRSYIRWNAMAMVLRANRHTNVGGHIASFASAATLYDVGYNHFWRAANEHQGGDLVYVQGHSAPGIYARAFLLDELTSDQLDNFRQEVGNNGLSSYPHPWLMPDFWQFPTVSMGLGPLMAIYQARFMKYLGARGLAQTEGRKVWAFMGDGEMDEPESLGAISLGAREKLDNLIFVINCNLQRLDGPVRGNGKIIQEMESTFRGAGWNVIKVIWGSYWDPLLAKDTKGLLQQRMMECVDGEYQTFKSRDGAYVRQHFFGKYPELLEMVANMSDDDIWRLNRGGHDPHKVYAAYSTAMKHTGQPTVILAKTIKGYGMGEAGEAQNITHQQKKMGTISLKAFRNRFGLPVPDDKIDEIPYLKLEEGSPEYNYMRARQQAMGGFIHHRRRKAAALQIPPLSAFETLLKASGEGRESSTTMAFVRILNVLVKDKNIGKHVVPIVADESRTFGMEGMFRQLGIWSSVGQLYTPEDADQLMYYKEDRNGQILQEGINEAGAMASWMAAATAYSTHGVQMIPFYIFYSMFGFQRIGDLAWAAGDMRCRGFLLGGTAGRTTLNGEGLQHEDGHSHLAASTIPNCVSYDPAFAYELAVIMQDGLRRMYQEQEDVYYYITVMNENYPHPEMPKGAEQGILQGMYLFRSGGKQRSKSHVQLLGSGTILREVIAAAEILEKDYKVSADIWSVTSFNQLRREALAVSRHNLLHPDEPARLSYVETCLKDREGPVIASTDYMKIVADQIREFIPGRYFVLGTDGFGRSDTREKLRQFFEVDRHYVVIAALKALADEGKIPSSQVTKAIRTFAIDPDKPEPVKI
ncbi:MULTISPECIES: pyruvate dehydrogenase (acetyl-transferring), homodimeric type [Nitrosomonas]|uniref:Pyruvate dehydrogenase E1 component n=1 Tax=Nitrosomonas europaea (strain ATCC 19718 / CIP 103999 / KCTC 2705 / NBRC 14298) TaxID=228410 RepID=Q82XC4_NITEU|nr:MULTISPECIES: pyruvate dehydrogenase (acetyl-transferring), homodimeric type [Nitrosomonas]KXK40966.1 MAG: pyruvate dehydrogenase subunit E1 [Nitrosomonas europaea]CAD84272.1 aceE; pyruvate dehydrogenase e1 component oxidoreductase protein [Nitrosomonas europaea ATCC 19718]SDW34970.1 pyruvate dehydrogenase E1 component [Nitrosomonas europaea]SES93535.1 pyruvate dehydrogenase E1 component [Nitrosomonas europaea]SJZ44939.1 pyruvate dehydrogenase E1 component [Nitrosomonas europaea]